MLERIFILVLNFFRAMGASALLPCTSQHVHFSYGFMVHFSLVLLCKKRAKVQDGIACID